MKLSPLCTLLGASAFCFTAVALAENQVIGTVEALLDGQARTWYVLDAETEDPAEGSGAIWMPGGDGLAMVVIGAFESKDVAFSKDATTGMYAARGEGSQISISFQITPGTPQRFDKLEPGMSGANVILMTRVGDYASMHPLGKGRIDVESANLDEHGPGRVEGRFEGTLTGPDEADWGQITEGRFEVSKVIPIRR